MTSGKVPAVGVSNYSPAQLAALVAHLHIPLASIQPELASATLKDRDSSSIWATGPSM